jgi:hypothetical protein
MSLRHGGWQLDGSSKLRVVGVNLGLGALVKQNKTETFGGGRGREGFNDVEGALDTQPSWLNCLVHIETWISCIYCI